MIGWLALKLDPPVFDLGKMLVLLPLTAMKQTTAKSNEQQRTVSYSQSDPNRDPSLPLTLFVFFS